MTRCLHPTLLQFLMRAIHTVSQNKTFLAQVSAAKSIFSRQPGKGPRQPPSLSTGAHPPPPLPVFVFLPWCNVWCAAPGRGGLTVSLGQRDLQRSSGSVTVLHPGWVKVWQSGPGSCWAAKQGLIHIGCPGLDPVAAGAAVRKVEGLHCAVPPGSSRCPVGVLGLPDSASRAPCERGQVS